MILTIGVLCVIFTGSALFAQNSPAPLREADEASDPKPKKTDKKEHRTASNAELRLSDLLWLFGS